jgi:hypothetical protein
VTNSNEIQPASLREYVPDLETGTANIRPRKGLLARQPKAESRVVAFDVLHQKLAVATELYLHKGDGGREGVYDATGALIEYLVGQGVPYAALEPLVAVQTAIVDADRGTESPVFAPTRTTEGGKPPKSDMQLAFEGKLAIVMECCVQHCRTENMRPFVRPAAQMAAKLINESRWPVKVTARQLRKLRERISQSPKDSIDRACVETAFQSGVAQSHPLAYAKCLLEMEDVNPLAKLSA